MIVVKHVDNVAYDEDGNAENVIEDDWGRTWTSHDVC